MKKLFLVLCLILPVEKVVACAVCFGDPNSPLTHGARAAVWVMLGIIGAVLSGILYMIYFWSRRARLLQVQAAIRGETPDA